MKTAEKADQHSRVSIELKQIADEIGAERESCQRLSMHKCKNYGYPHTNIYEMLSPTTVVQTRPLIQCQLQDFEDSSFS